MDKPLGGMPGLVLCAHGTRDAEGARVTAAVAAAVAAQLPAVEVRLAYVDVQQPSVADLVASRAGHQQVLVPLLLSFGYHVEADIRTTAAAHAGAVATQPLGPDRRLAAVLARRLAEAGIPQSQPVVLAVAGSSQPRAAADAETTRVQLATLRSGPVHLAFAAAQDPLVPDAVRAIRARGEPTAVVTAYLLAPGHFLGVLRGAGADVVTEPIGSAPEVVDIVMDRYREGLSLLGRPAGGRA
ncbi:MAG: CbiX/SirB N-terminal domain-containing protein [Dermatophilaceae bacterium]